MKFTSEDLMKAMGLQVGDRIKVKGFSDIFEVIKSHEGILRIVGTNTSLTNIDWLIDEEYEILPRPKRVGDTLCKDIECDNCPLRMVQGCENVLAKYTLYQCLEEIKDYNENHDSFDQEIHDLLKARLDKEVNE